MKIETLLSGNSLHLAVEPAGSATLHFAADGTLSALLPSGVNDTGRWTLRSPDSYCIDWANGPKESCTRIEWREGVAWLYDVSGKLRGRVTRVVPGRDPILL